MRLCTGKKRSPISVATILGLLIAHALGTCFAADPERPLRLHEVQCLGTHNSYHIAPDAVASRMIRTFVPQEADANDYSHRPLTEQLQRLGIRQFELDLYVDLEGGRFAQPAALKMAAQQKTEVPAYDPNQQMRKPGIKILHSPDFDFRTTVYSFRDALRELRRWSEAHPRHFPVFLLLELKSDSFSPLTRPAPWNTEALSQLEEEIFEVLERRQILAANDIRGEEETLRETIERIGWPTVESARGKFIFLLDNEDRVRDVYLTDGRASAAKLLFPSLPRTHPSASWMKRNDPVGSFDEIQSLVRAGFLVRTRADSGTREARANDTRTRDRAWASGAQLISTDFPEVDPRFPGYVVQWPGGAIVRRNPVNTGSDKIVEGLR